MPWGPPPHNSNKTGKAIKTLTVWDKTSRDSEHSQLPEESAAAAPSVVYTSNAALAKAQQMQAKTMFSTSCEGVVAVCLSALNKNKNIFTTMMCTRELAAPTAKEIAHRLFQLHLDWAYLCKEATEKCLNYEICVILNASFMFCGRYEQQMGTPLHRSATAVVIEVADHGVVAEYAQSYPTYLSQEGR